MLDCIRTQTPTELIGHQKLVGLTAKWESGNDMEMVRSIDAKSPFGTYQLSGLGRFMWRLAEWRFFSLAVRKAVRSVVGRYFGGPFDEEVEGIRFRTYPTDNYDDRKIISKRRLPERLEHKVLTPYLKPGVTFVDVGANIGTYSLYAAELGANVFAIEANPASAEKLAFNIRVNRYNKVELARTAVGEVSDKMQLWSESSNSGFSTLVKELTKGKWNGNWRPTEVTIQPLKEILKNCKMETKMVLKLDVEGFEDRVLLPYLNSSKPSKWPSVVLLETNCRDHWNVNLLDVLARVGYETKAETVDNKLMELRTPRIMAEMDHGSSH